MTVSTKLIQAAAGAGGPVGWYAISGATSQGSFAPGTPKINSNGDFSYLSKGGNYTSPYLITIDSDAAVTENSSNVNGSANEFYIDASNNLYVSHTSYSTQYSRLYKYDASRTDQWGKGMSLAGSSARGLAYDPNSSVFFVRSQYSSGATRVSYINRFNTSGSMLTGYYAIPNFYSVGNPIVESNGSVNMFYQNKFTTSDYYVVNYSSTYSINSTYKFSNGYLLNMEFDGSGNKFLLYHYPREIVKFTASNAATMQTAAATVAVFNSASTQLNFGSMAVGSSGNVYAVAVDFSVSPYASYLVKLDNNLSLQWAQKITAASGSGYGDFNLGRVIVDDDDVPYVTGTIELTSTGNTQTFAAKLSPDGNLSGTYDDLEFSVDAATTTTPSYSGPSTGTVSHQSGQSFGNVTGNGAGTEPNLVVTEI